MYVFSIPILLVYLLLIEVKSVNLLQSCANKLLQCKSVVASYHTTEYEYGLMTNYY